VKEKGEMKNRLAVSTLLLLGLMLLGSATNVLAYEIWHGVSNGVEAIISKEYSADSVTFTVQIISDNIPHGVYGTGIIISWPITTHKFQVFLDPSQGNLWYYQQFTGHWWDNVPLGAGVVTPQVALTASGTGITATGTATDKTKTVTIPVSLLGGYGATYYYAILFTTNIMGTYPAPPVGNPHGMSWMWYETDATNFATNQVPAPPAPPVGGEWVPMNTVQVLVPLFGYIVVMSAIVASFVGFKRMKKKQN
jgi:hypothetical protein